MSSNVIADPVADQNQGSAVLAMIRRREKWLVIRRSRYVRAPGMICFPGGGVEPGESMQEALVREIREELDVTITPVREVWKSKTASGICLHWWISDLDSHARPIPNPHEVQACWWSTLCEIQRHTDMLPSNRSFFDALSAGAIDEAIFAGHSPRAPT